MTIAELFIQCLVALGTFLVAVLAVYGDWFRFKLASPRIKIDLHNPAGTFTQFGDGRLVRYYHLMVSNQRIWATAQNVRVLIRSILKPAADGSFLPAAEVGGLQLTWCYPGSGPMYRQIGSDEFYDLGFVTQEGFKFSTYVTPNNFIGVLTDQGGSAPKYLQWPTMGVRFQ